MIIKKQESEASTNLEGTSFGITSDASFLIDSLVRLYENPMEAILRELVSNAYDATVDSEAEVENKVVVTIGKNLTVNDFGKGMSPEFMRTKYTQVGFSDKRTSANSIGGFGLGRLSVLTKTDSYLVTTHSGGKKYVWAIWKDGEIKIDLLSEEESDDVGTSVQFEISIPFEWYNCAKRVLQYFDNILIYLEEDGSKFYTKPEMWETYYVGNENYLGVVLGKVHYPINFNALGIQRISSVASIKFELDELNPLPNRESLRYDEETINLLKSRIDEFVNLCDKILEEKKEECVGLVEKAENRLNFLIEHKGELIYKGNYSDKWKYILEPYFIASPTNFFSNLRPSHCGPNHIFYEGIVTKKITEYFQSLGFTCSKVKAQTTSYSYYSIEGAEQRKKEFEEVLNYYREKYVLTKEQLLAKEDYIQFLKDNKKTRSVVTGELKYYRESHKDRDVCVIDKISMESVIKQKVPLYINVPKELRSIFKKGYAVLPTSTQLNQLKQMTNIFDFDQFNDLPNKDKLILAAKLRNIGYDRVYTNMVYEMNPHLYGLARRANEIVNSFRLSYEAAQVILELGLESSYDFPIEYFERELSYFPRGNFRQLDPHFVKSYYIRSKMASMIQKKNGLVFDFEAKDFLEYIQEKEYQAFKKSEAELNQESEDILLEQVN